jgi:hypothetical protein
MIHAAAPTRPNHKGDHHRAGRVVMGASYPECSERRSGVTCCAPRTISDRHQDGLSFLCGLPSSQSLGVTIELAPAPARGSPGTSAGFPRVGKGQSAQEGGRRESRRRRGRDDRGIAKGVGLTGSFASPPACASGTWMRTPHNCRGDLFSARIPQAEDGAGAVSASSPSSWARKAASRTGSSRTGRRVWPRRWGRASAGGRATPRCRRGTGAAGPGRGSPAGSWRRCRSAPACPETLSGVPALVPVYKHRYLPTMPSESGNPVLSVVQTDIIYYGNDLLDWFDYEFR